MNKFPACFDKKVGMNFEKDTDLFLLCKQEVSTTFVGLISECNHSIFRYDNFIGCFSADKIKMSVRK